MDRDLLIHLPTVLTVARRGGFAAAASELGMSPSAVSHAVKTVEARLGLPLFTRTTRSVALTDWGREFVDKIAPALRDIGEAADGVRAARGRVSGLLRLNAPRIALPICVTPVIEAMAARHRALTVEVFAEGASIDIVAAGFDAGIRIGGMIDQEMTAVRLTGPLRMALAAAPDLLAKHGEPRVVDDLRALPGIAIRRSSTGGLYGWTLRSGNETIAFEPVGPVIVNDPLYAIDLAIRGLGVVSLPEPLIREATGAGRLVPILPDAWGEKAGFHLYFTAQASRNPKLRAFIETARAVLRP